MTPLAYVHALERVRTAIVGASVTVDIVNVGGGFPSIYPDLEPVSLNHYFTAIDRTFEDLPISYSAELWCEPGRALSAEYSSLVVKLNAVAATSCSSTTAPMARFSMLPISVGVSRCA